MGTQLKARRDYAAKPYILFLSFFFFVKISVGVKSVSKITINDVNGFDKHLSDFLRPNDKLAMIFDFDGTLSVLSSDPESTKIDDESGKYLRTLTRNPNIFLAIISGRGLYDLKSRAQVDNIVYSGNHGLEISYPNGTYYLYPISDELKENFTELYNALDEELAHNGAYVENKTVSLTFHYPEEPKELHKFYDEKAKSIIQYYGYIALQGYRAIEAVPTLLWNKGDSVLFMLRDKFGPNWPDNVKVLFAGDADSDEHAMKVINGKGISFKVTTVEDNETYADYLLPSIRAVAMLLKWIEKRMN